MRSGFARGNGNCSRAAWTNTKTHDCDGSGRSTDCTRHAQLWASASRRAAAYIPSAIASCIVCIMTGSTPPPFLELLLFLIAVEGLVLGKVLTGVGEFLGLRLGIDMAYGAGFLCGLCVFRLAIRGRGTNQKTAQ